MINEVYQSYEILDEPLIMFTGSRGGEILFRMHKFAIRSLGE